MPSSELLLGSVTTERLGEKTWDLGCKVHACFSFGDKLVPKFQFPACSFLFSLIHMWVLPVSLGFRGI